MQYECVFKNWNTKLLQIEFNQKWRLSVQSRVRAEDQNIKAWKCNFFSRIIESYFILRAFKVKLIQSAQDLMFFWEREVHPQTFIHF